MPGGVGKGLLDDPQERGRDLLVQLLVGAGDRELGSHTRPFAPFGDRLLQGLRQSGVGQRHGGEVVHGAAGLSEAVPGQVRRPGHVCTGQVRVRGVHHDLELSDDAGQPLGDGVVDLGSQPPALVGDSGLPGLHQELDVQGGVLVEGLLQGRVGALQFGDGRGLDPGAFLLPPGQLAEDDQQHDVEAHQPAEQRPVQRPVQGKATGLGTRQDHRGGHQPDHERAAPQQPLGADEPGGAVEREERVAPGEHEGQRPAHEVVAGARHRRGQGPAAGPAPPPQLEEHRGADQDDGGVPLHRGHADRVDRGRRERGACREHPVRPPAEVRRPPLLHTRHVRHAHSVGHGRVPSPGSGHSQRNQRAADAESTAVHAARTAT